MITTWCQHCWVQFESTEYIEDFCSDSCKEKELEEQKKYLYPSWYNAPYIMLENSLWQTWAVLIEEIKRNKKSLSDTFKYNLRKHCKKIYDELFSEWLSIEQERERRKEEKRLKKLQAKNKSINN